MFGPIECERRSQDFNEQFSALKKKDGEAKDLLSRLYMAWGRKTFANRAFA